MRHAGRAIAILASCTTWCIAASSIAYAVEVPDRGAVGSSAVTSPGSTDAPLWQFLAFLTLGVLLAIAIVGLGYALSHSRMSQSSSRSQTPLRS